MDPMERLKEGVKWMWSLGEYAEVAALLEPYAIGLVDSCDLRPGTRVLDVAAGNGNFAIAAAARGAEVTACDLTPRMVEMGRARSGAAGVAVEWLEGDAENLPFPDGRFDVVASVFGAMFAPRPDLVARELFRVARLGGLVAMANYGWEGHLGSVSKLMSNYSSRAPMDLPSPFEWGDAAEVRRRFDGLASSVEIEPAVIRMALPTVEEGIAFWERTNGPHMALRTLLPADRYQQFRREAEDLMREMNRSRDGHLELESSYVRVLARK